MNNQFLQWLEQTDPFLYKVLVYKSTGQLNGVFGDIWGSIKNGATQLVSSSRELISEAAKLKIEKELQRKLGDKYVVEGTKITRAETQPVVNQMTNQAQINTAIINENLRRAQMGLPPITEGYQPLVNYQNTPAMNAAVGKVASNVSQYAPLYIGAIVGLVGFFLIARS